MVKICSAWPRDFFFLSLRVPLGRIRAIEHLRREVALRVLRRHVERSGLAVLLVHARSAVHHVLRIVEILLQRVSLRDAERQASVLLLLGELGHGAILVVFLARVGLLLLRRGPRGRHGGLVWIASRLRGRRRSGARRLLLLLSLGLARSRLLRVRLLLLLLLVLLLLRLLLRVDLLSLLLLLLSLVHHVASSPERVPSVVTTIGSGDGSGHRFRIVGGGGLNNAVGRSAGKVLRRHVAELSLVLSELLGRVERVRVVVHGLRVRHGGGQVREWLIRGVDSGSRWFASSRLVWQLGLRRGLRESRGHRRHGFGDLGFHVIGTIKPFRAGLARLSLHLSSLLLLLLLLRLLSEEEAHLFSNASDAGRACSGSVG